MARGGRRVAAGGGGGRRGCGGGVVPGSTESITAGWRYVAAQVWMRQMIEKKQSKKRVIEPSQYVDPERDSRMTEDMPGSFTGLTVSGEMDKFGPLHEAASMERIERCKYLLEDIGFDINAVANNDSGITPLACAVSCGKAIAVRYLLEKGADPDKEDFIGCTPLHYAAKQGNDALVRLLLSKGASVNASSSEGTPLHIASSHGKSAIVHILLQNNADPNRICADLGTPMTAAVLGACLAHGESAALKCMKLLVKAGADLNHANPDTPLVIATCKGLPECVKYLLEVGADANIPINHGGTTPMEIAADSGRRELVEILFPHTSPIQSVSNWSVEGIIAYARSRHSKEGDASWEKLKETFKLFASPPLLPLPPAHHLSPHYRTVLPAELVPTLAPEHHLYMSPYYFPSTPAQHLGPLYNPMPVQFPDPAPTALPHPVDMKPSMQWEEDES